MESVQLLNEKIEKALLLRHIDYNGIEKSDGEFITDILVAKKAIDSSTANLILEEATGVQSIDPTFVSFDSKFLRHMKDLLPLDEAKKESAFPIRHEGNYVHIVMANPNDEARIKRLEYLTGSRITPYCCHTAGIAEAIRTYYGEQDAGADEQQEDVSKITDRALTAINRLTIENADISAIINDVSVIWMLQFILNTLVHRGASDLHFEPMEDCFRVRARIDGVMQTAWTFPSIIKKGIINRLKLISGMDLNETSYPQDGGISYNLLKNREADIRVSALPAIYGEKIVLRILDKGKERLTIKDLGLEQSEFELIQQVMKRPNGLILMTGPTGSGKTTTLYAMLNELNTDEVNISTAEDPVEYKLKGLIQVNCTSDTGMTFKDVLKSLLRQDPDIIMVGEIRDSETADIAVKSAMTGHIVLSTLHTNDAASAVNRLINMGVPPYLVASANISVIAQRLMRRICSECRQEYDPDKEMLKMLGAENENIRFYQGAGCEACNDTGYKGRVGIYELFVVNEELIELILNKEPSNVLKAAAVKQGMKTLRKAAMEKLAEGITTIDEVLRVTMEV